MRAGDGRTAAVARVATSTARVPEPPHAGAYGDACAAFYDELYPPPSRAMIDTLVALADGGIVLDAGSGTGRVLLALAARGVRAEGVEAAPAMIAAMRAKAGGEAIVVQAGDFATLPLPRRHALVACLVDTLALLPDAATQARAIANLARSLVPGGALLVQSSRAAVADPVVAHDGVTVHSRTGPRQYRAALCPTATASLDAWSRAAGLRLAARWRDWRRVDDDGAAAMPISCYRRQA